MANTQGGVVLLGVKNDGTITGVTDIDKCKKQFWDSISNKQVVNVNLLSNSDVQIVSNPKGSLIAIRIPRADRRDRPIYTGQNPLTGTYRRNHEGDYHCTEREVRRMLADSAEETADSRILEKFTLDDLDRSSLQQYRNRLTSKKPSHPWLEEDDMGLLQKLGGWGTDRKEGIEGLTVAGLLMFGRDDTIREAMPQYQIDFRERLSLDPAVRWTDRLTQDGTWAGNLYQFYHRVFQKLSSDLKLPFELDKDLSRKEETSVHVAIREALANALIHADYQGQGGVVIEKYPDRFELSNPGSLLISLDQVLRGGVSECRNKFLQRMFTMIGVAEKAGSGVDKIKKGWLSQHWRSPIIREQSCPDRVTWTLPMLSLIPDESMERLKLRFGNKLFNNFSEFEVQALVTADVEHYVDNARMRQITGTHAADITKILQNLVAQGVLRQDGQGRWTRYILPSAPDSLHSKDHSLHLSSDSLHLKSHSLHLDEIEPTKWAQLENAASLARKSKRLKNSEMEDIILILCEDRWLTRNQISDLVRRNADGLSNRFLTPMVHCGKLELRYPDRPNRVDQAYRMTRKLSINEEQ